MTNILTFLKETISIDDIVYCIVNEKNEFFHLEDAIQMFRTKEGAENCLSDDEITFLQKEHQAYYRKNAVIKKARLTSTRLCLSDKVYFMSLTDDNTIKPISLGRTQFPILSSGACNFINEG